jgi:hypothetical protein
MVVVGSVWSGVGAAWLYFLFPGYIVHERLTIAVFPTALIWGGLLLPKTG